MQIGDEVEIISQKWEGFIVGFKNGKVLVQTGNELEFSAINKNDIRIISTKDYTLSEND